MNLPPLSDPDAIEKAFVTFYKAANGKENDPDFGPFPWQKRLAKRVCGGQEWPRAIALPTAAGKTTCIDIAVFALACRVKTAPRRIFFVVDRRIVVDQAFLHADKLARVLKEAKNGILKTVADSLRELAQDNRPLDVYALRGGMYRETAWARSPLQPTVIASTVDQVGSRLLFRGYGVSDSMKPVHAALVGNDALVLLDEAHCAKPFEQTVRAVENYRGWNDAPAAFRFVSVTATPTGDGEVMTDDVEDQGHPVLGKRIAANKPAKLVVVEKAKGKKFTAELVKELKRQAEELAERFACVGVIVNRVQTARELKAALGEDAVLLTGRMRPLDRDRLFNEKLRPLLSNAEGAPPKFVIGTQCLEVGADFDFHALVTECASLDALRQRFGRLNRVANREEAEAVVVIRGDQTEPKEKEAEQDPIYGNSLPNTWQFLIGEDGKRTIFDFGVAAVRKALADVSSETLAGMNAPAPDAPVLFPANLDCWVQTNPIPHPDPDVAVFLHGPKQTGQPDVQVALRDDLGDDPEKWAEVVTLVPPSSSEAVAVPIGVFKKWLAGETAEDNSGDIEGGATVNDDADGEVAVPRPALCWKGAESYDTGVVRDPKDVRPNRTYVVSCSVAARQLADFIGLADTPPVDYAEEAFQRSRDKAVLRLPAITLAEELTDDEVAEAVTAAIQQRQADDSPDWMKRAVAELADPKKRIVEVHPVAGLVVVGKRRLHQFDPEFLDDANSSYSPGRAVTLADHSRGVATWAEKFAAALDLDAETYRRAGFYHDLGKLDPRFQAMLKQSSPRTAVGVPWAKSAKSPRTKAERDAAREVHRYPAGGRHELLSDAILAPLTSDDLLRHLIATHHGSARPFADPVDENDAVKSPFSGELLGLKFSLPSSRQDIAVWNAELPERFWRVVRQYGWWGSAFREAVFRLADHAESRAEQEKDWTPADVPNDVPPPLAPYAEPRRLHPLPLPGLDGANPLAFLAALGTLRLADQLCPGVKLRWQAFGHWHPVLELDETIEVGDFVDRVHAHVHKQADATASQRAAQLDKEYRQRRKATAQALKAVKERKLKGELREQAIEAEVRPLERLELDARRMWLSALEAVVPAPFLSLGNSIAVPATEFAAFAARMAERLNESKPCGRSDADFVPAFGCEASTDDDARIIPTQLQLITGSGHQFFLKTFGDLMESITTEQLSRALFGPWTYQDPRLSFRWEPLDDRRYATSWGDPSDEAVFTEHGANLLAAFALPFFPVVPRPRRALTTGFHVADGSAFLTWPIWETALGVDAIKSMFQATHLHQPHPERSTWSSLGVTAVFRVRKHEVGKPPLSKWNISTSVAV